MACKSALLLARIPNSKMITEQTIKYMYMRYFIISLICRKNVRRLYIAGWRGWREYSFVIPTIGSKNIVVLISLNKDNLRLRVEN